MLDKDYIYRSFLFLVKSYNYRDRTIINTDRYIIAPT